MAVASDGSYGVPEGLISSFPVTTKDGDWEIVQGLEIDEFSRGRIDASVAELDDERAAVTELGPDLRSRSTTSRRPAGPGSGGPSASSGEPQTGWLGIVPASRISTAPTTASSTQSNARCRTASMPASRAGSTSRRQRREQQRPADQRTPARQSPGRPRRCRPR